MKKKTWDIRYLFQKLALCSSITRTNSISATQINKSLAEQIFLLLTLIVGVVSVASGEISVTVCLSDGNTPLALVDPNIPYVYRDIMVGAKLIIVVSSDTNKPWQQDANAGGSLAIEEEYWPYGVLSARGPLVGGDWSGSHLPAAGAEAVVYDWEEEYIDGFDLYTGSTNIEAGDWFVIDYNAIGVGDCNVGFYDHRVSWDEPIYYLSFSHVRTRDFNRDTVVDFADFAMFASHWQMTGCMDPGWCDGTDLDVNGDVDINDLMLFCEFWLERI
jgi:hypothetical protein